MCRSGSTCPRPRFVPDKWGIFVVSGKTIICFASGWDYHPTSKHHIMRMLADRNNIIWVNWHASRRPNIRPADLRHMVGRLWQVRQGPRRVSDSISVITPLQAPLPGSAWARRWNAWNVRRAVNNIMDKLPRRPVQIWSFAPDVSDLIGAFDEELALYYCVDAFGEFPGYDRALIERRERELMSRCDLVITTSPPLYETRKQLHPNVHFVQHGVNYAHLSRAVDRTLAVPKELQALRRPVIGFVGIVGEWVDLDLVAGIARSRPDASVVMIGPEMISRGPCAGLPNIHWLGGRSHQVLPDYLQCFDVALIPFKQTALTYNANPIKLYEYLAAGVPAVCSTLPSVKQVPRSVWLADHVGDMVRCCDEAFACNTSADRRARSRAMQSESWTARLEQISTHLEDAKTTRVMKAAHPVAGDVKCTVQSA